MDQLMCLQIHFCLERLLAALALEASVFLLFVSQQVFLQSLCSPKLPGAAVTGKRPLLLVSVHVLCQVKPTAKPLLAELTHKLLSFRLQHCFLCLLGFRVF